VEDLTKISTTSCETPSEGDGFYSSYSSHPRFKYPRQLNSNSIDKDEERDHRELTKSSSISSTCSESPPSAAYYRPKFKYPQLAKEKEND
jgi:hypothetical protein